MEEFENLEGGSVAEPKVPGMGNETKNDLAVNVERSPIFTGSGPWRIENVMYLALQSLLGIVVVIVGTALGNGVPMARSTGEAFRIGVQAGLKNCPCASKGQNVAKQQAGSGGGPTPLAVPDPLKPMAEPEPIVLKPVSEVVK